MGIETILGLGLGIGGSMFAGGMFGGKDKAGEGMPTLTAEQPKETAARTSEAGLTDREKKNRRLAASWMSKELGAPTLGRAGLVGL